MHYHPEELVRDISAKAQAYRIQVLNMVYNAQTGHLGGALSMYPDLAREWPRTPAHRPFPTRLRWVFLNHRAGSVHQEDRPWWQ